MMLLVNTDLYKVENNPVIVYNTDTKEWENILIKMCEIPDIPQLNSIKLLKLKLGHNLISIFVESIIITDTELNIKPVYCELS